MNLNSNMKKNLTLKFTIFYFTSVSLTWILNLLSGLSLNFESILILSFIISFYLILFNINSRINDSIELTKANYWQLKNRLKKPNSSNNKNNKGKQLLKD